VGLHSNGIRVRTPKANDVYATKRSALSVRTFVRLLLARKAGRWTRKRRLPVWVGSRPGAQGKEISPVWPHASSFTRYHTLTIRQTYDVHGHLGEITGNNHHQRVFLLLVQRPSHTTNLGASARSRNAYPNLIRHLLQLLDLTCVNWDFVLLCTIQCLRPSLSSFCSTALTQVYRWL